MATAAARRDSLMTVGLFGGLCAVLVLLGFSGESSLAVGAGIAGMLKGRG